MDRAAEIDLLKTLLHYLDTKTTCMADAPWRNEVTAFTCPERHKREQEVLIRQAAAGHGAVLRLAQPGAYRTEDFAGVPILTVRGSDGKLRAFLNVCRHRGAKVAQGCGSAGAFTCPYHGWTYGNDGVLRGLPEEATSFPGVSAERPGLTPLPLAEKYGMVWVLPTPAANRSADLDIEPWLDGLGPDLASWKLDSYHFHDRHVHYEEMNWKLLVDTFHEGYHFGFLHKESLSGILVHNVGHFTPFGPNFRLVFGRTKLDRLRSTPESEWDLMWNSTIVYSMFANTIFAPQGDHMEIFRMFPVDGRLDRAADGDLALHPQARRDRGREAALGCQPGARRQGRDHRGFPGRPHHADRLQLGRAKPHRLRPQRAGPGALPQVDPARAGLPVEEGPVREAAE